MRAIKLFSILLAALSLFAACAPSYNRCKQLYGDNSKPAKSDTVFVMKRDSVLVPGDSVFFSVPTAATPLRQTVQQGRARVTLDRTAKTTTVQADCLPEKLYFLVRESQIVNHRPIFKNDNFWLKVALWIVSGLAIAGWGYWAVNRFVVVPRLLIKLAKENGNRIV